MRIEFDPRKQALNIAKHSGLDFAELDQNFFVTAKLAPAKKGRFIATGLFKEQLITVVFCRLGREGLSVMSMRRASRKERRLW